MNSEYVDEIQNHPRLYAKLEIDENIKYWIWKLVFYSS